MTLRRSLAAVAIALIVTGVGAAPAFAKGDHGAKHAAKHAKHHHRKFVVVGSVTAVGASSITVMVHGGNQRALAGHDKVVNVAANASIRRNDAGATLADVKAGDHVMLQGTKDGDTFTASKVRAEAPDTAEAPADAPKA